MCVFLSLSNGCRCCWGGYSISINTWWSIVRTLVNEMKDIVTGNARTPKSIRSVPVHYSVVPVKFFQCHLSIVATNSVGIDIISQQRSIALISLRNCCLHRHAERSVQIGELLKMIRHIDYQLLFDANKGAFYTYDQCIHCQCNRPVLVSTMKWGRNIMIIKFSCTHRIKQKSKCQYLQVQGVFAWQIHGSNSTHIHPFRRS